MNKILNFIHKCFGREKILFADLDGTLIITRSGKDFPEHIDDWMFKWNTIRAIINYNPDYLHIVSNQGGIEKGFVKEEKFRQKMSIIVRLLQERMPHTRVSYAYCKSLDKNDERRKPNPGMLIDFTRNTDCDTRQCLMIGDASGLPGQFSDSDKKCAEAFGCKYLDVFMFTEKYL